MKRVILLSLIVSGAAAGLLMTEGRAYAMRLYGAPCGEASGFVGLLQKTHFLPSATCTVKTGGGCVTQGTICTLKSPVSGGITSGTCRTVGTGCSCVNVVGQ
jgi:formate/nitrite transporter FocA (FNT family)